MTSRNAYMTRRFSVLASAGPLLPLFTRTTHLLTRHLKHWLPSEMSDSNYSLTHCILQTWPQATFICFLNWRNSWRDADLLTTRMLSAQQMTGWKTKIKNSSTTESELWRNAGPSAFQLKETVLKSDKIWCAYLMVNCVRLRTFWMPLVYYFRTISIDDKLRCI